MTRFLRALLLIVVAAPALAQQSPHVPPPNISDVRVHNYLEGTQRGLAVGDLFDPALRPFYHGVASGDPTATGVVLWTRVTPDEDAPVPVSWEIGTGFDEGGVTDVVQTGTATASLDSDYTLQVFVEDLDPNTTYYYAFQALDRSSLIGRTRTAPTDAVDQLRFAFVSCSNYDQGYFNAYGRISERADLDAVLHLGDYFYEYGENFYGNPALDRELDPAVETVTLGDYRIRHSLYKLDPDLRRAHQQHPFITIWDDHESANDAWEGGAENHNEIVSIDTTFNGEGEIVSIDTTFAQEGPWPDRKAEAIQAYREWLPLRLPDPQDVQRIWRSLSYGPRAELHMLDTRLWERDEQLAVKSIDGPPEVDTVAWFDEERRLLGSDQLDWLQNGLAASTAQWKVLGNQVMMTKLAPHPLFPGESAPFTNLDAWDGYPAERDRVLGYIAAQGIDNVAVVTGDIHTAWSSDLPLDPFTTYDPSTGDGSVAVEFVTPSVSAANLDELGVPPSEIEQNEGLLPAVYPQIKAVDLDRHGYTVLDLTESQAQADWFLMETILEPSDSEAFWRGFATADGQNTLTAASAPAPEKPNPPALAPAAAPNPTSTEGPAIPEAALLVVGSYPNPARDAVRINYVVGRPVPLRLVLYDVLGREVAVLLDQEQGEGVYTISFDTSSLPSGAYVYRFETEGQTVTRKMLIQR